MLAKPVPQDGVEPITDWAKAQEHANFVLLRPKPKAGWKVYEESLRGESKSHYSSLRLVVERAGVRFRLKQSLNDWWVPVGNDINLRSVDGHFLLGEEVVFTGRDYHGRPGACAQIHGTTVESYLLEGMPTQHLWSESLAQLEAAVPDVLAEARRTSFAERSYWGRWRRDTGPWDSHEFTRPNWMRPDPETIEKVAWSSTPDQWAAMPGAPDSVASHEAKGRREMQVLFRQPMTLNYTSWLRAAAPPEKEGPVAPRDPRYPKLGLQREIRGRRVNYAALRPEVGPWFFSWEDAGRAWEMHIRAAKGLDEENAIKKLDMVLKN